MKRMILSAILVLAAGAPTAANPLPCTVPSVLIDVNSSLAGDIGVTNIVLTWNTDDEGNDLSHYEVWVRFESTSELLAVIAPFGQCSDQADYESTVPYYSEGDYFVEVHEIQDAVRTFHALEVETVGVDLPPTDPPPTDHPPLDIPR